MSMTAALGVLIVLFLALSGCASLNAEKIAPPIGEFVETGAARMHALLMGPEDAAAPPVVLIHGASVNLRDMKIALGDPLSKERRVLMIDRPGRGYSERDDNGYRLASQAEAIHGVVRAYGLEDYIVVGQSFGGAVALNYALQYQDEMAGLVLLAPVSHEWPGGVDWYNNVSETPVLGFFLRRLIIPAYGSLAGRDVTDGSFAPNEPPENYYARAGVPLLFRPRDFKANAADIAHLKDEIRKQEDRYGEISVPTAIAAGEADDTVSPRIHAQPLARQIDGATLTMFPDTGHALHHARTEEIVEMIEAVASR